MAWSSMVPLSRVLAAVLLLVCAVPAQEPLPRWLVTLRGRGFDLEPLRAAVASGVGQVEVRTLVADLEKRAVADQQEIARRVAELGGKVTRHWWIVSGCAVELAEAQVEALREHPRVAAVEPDALVGPAGGFAPIKDATNANNHNADALQALGIKGSGVTVAILDSGQDERIGQLSRPHSVYFVNGDPLNQTGGGLAGSRLLANFKVGGMPADDITGHGTAVAAVAAGEKWDASPTSDSGHAPSAGVVGYSVADDSAANALFSTLISAWQKVASDRVAYRIVAANNSYLGSPSPTHLSQQALDTTAWVADVLITVAAANFGASTASSQSCANGLAVGAVYKDTHAVAEFSCRGPLYGDAQRYFPDLVGNGVEVFLPVRDDETSGSGFRGSGTSFGAPQVAGAALLFRSVRTTASALETKAALLASTDDISGRNLVAPYATRNAYGMGYLRDDRLLALAQGSGLLRTDALTGPGQKKSFTLNVQSGRWYAAAIAWRRLDVTSNAWSNLELRAFSGTTVLAESLTPRNLYEKVVCRANASGTFRFEVEGASLDAASVPFALAAIEVPAPYLDGTVTAYGQGCPGSGYGFTVPTGSPSGAFPTFGNASSDQPLGSEDGRLQVVFAPAAVPFALSVNGVAFRHDESVWMAGLPFSFDLTVEMGTAAVLPSAIGPTFAANASGTPVTVLARRRIALEPPAAANAAPGNFAYRIPVTDQPFVWLPLPGRGLLWQCTHEATAPGYGPAYRVTVDALQDPGTAPLLSSVFSTQASSATGTPRVGFAPILGWMLLDTGGAVPTLTALEAPRIGASYRLQLGQAVTAGTGVLQIGWSDSVWGSVPLPLDLTWLGAPGCALLASGEAQLPFLTDGAGRASIDLLIPSVPGIVGGRLHQQALLLDARANGLGVTTSGALRTMTGGPR